jgi:hypothetical protein
MERSTLRTLARSLGGQLIYSDSSLMTFGFPSDNATLEFRRQVPFLTLWGGAGIDDNVPALNVYLDTLAA